MILALFFDCCFLEIYYFCGTNTTDYAKKNIETRQCQNRNIPI